mmetsp:Transcript_7146/g.15496  ORF Transcript_7146/g.15496 Transcript_7146/m.15496 type:complete len:348 (+) Transcript_7146:432-1475(+)
MRGGRRGGLDLTRTYPFFFELSAGSENVGDEVVDAGLYHGSGGLGDAVEISRLDPSGAEHLSIRKVLGGQISDGKLGENHLRPAVHALVELVIDDLPLGVHDGLILGRIGNAHLSVLLLSLELQLDVEQQDLRVFELLRHLFEPGVAKGFFEGHPVHEEGLSHLSARHLFDGHQIQIGVGVQRPDRVHDHRREEILMRRNELRIQRGGGALQDHLRPLLPLERHGHIPNLLHRQGRAGPQRPDNHLGMGALLHEGLDLGQHLGRQEDHGGGAVAHLGVLAEGDVHQGLGGGVLDLEHAHDGGAVVGDGHAAPVEEELVHAAGAQGAADAVGDGGAGVDVADQLGLAL